MYSHEIKLRVRYAETDKMGYVYYGNYAIYFEVARVEALRALGMDYKSMEDDGIMLPVHSYDIKYLKPAYYDQELTIVCNILQMPTTRLVFEYKTYNAEGILLNTANTTLVFVNAHSGRPTPPPEFLVKQLKVFFN